MDLSAEQTIRAPRDAVWAALNDPDILKACIPGADEVVRSSDTTFAVAMVASVGPVKARFRARLELSEVVPPESYTVTFDGQGGAAGFSKGTAKVALSQTAETLTSMRYAVHAQIGGKLAQVGQRLVDAAARKVADDFFARFKAKVEVAEPDASSPETRPTAAVGRSASTSAGWLPWVCAALFALMLWMGAMAR